MKRFFHTGRSRASASWAAFAVVLAATAWSVRLGTIGWTVFGLGLTVVMLVPPVAFRSLRTMPPWPVTMLAAIPFALGVARTGEPIGEFAAHAAVAAVAILVVVQLDAFTPIEMNRGFAIAMVVMTTVTAAGVWELSIWIWDHVAGTALVERNDAVMWRLVWAAAAGVVAGVLFDRYLRRLSHDTFVPDGFDSRDAIDEVDSAGETVTGLLARAGVSEERQLLIARGLQIGLVVLLGVGIATLEVNLAVNAGIGLGATLLPGVLERDYHTPTDAGLTLWIAVAVFLHALGSFGLYQTIWGWHSLTHALSGTLVAGVGYTTLTVLEAHTESVSVPAEFTFVLVVLFVFSVGVFWEILEFGLDGVGAVVGAGDVILSQHGIDDTMSDLLADTFGALLVASAATLYREGRRTRSE